MDCNQFYRIYDSYILIIVSSIGFILNLLCIIVFYGSPQLMNTKTNMFKYLRVKSICDTIAMIRNITRNFFFVGFDNYSDYHPSLHLCRLYVFIYYYIGGVVLLLSILCEVAANFNRYRTMTNTFKFFDRFKFHLKLSIMILYCSIFYIYRIIYFQCIEEVESDSSLSENSSNDSNSSYFNHYFKSNTSFSFNTTNSSDYLDDSHDLHHVYYIDNLSGIYNDIFSKFHTFVRDCLTMFLILVFSIATMLVTRNSFKKTRVTNTQTKESDAKKKQNLRAQKAQSNMTKMVLISNLVLFLGHSPSFIKFMVGNINNYCYTSIELILFFLAYSVNFFIYFSFNKHFRNYVLLFGRRELLIEETTQFATNK